MKNDNDPLQRLFRAARCASRAEAAEVVEPPVGFEARVLAAWRCSQLADESLWILTLFRRAAVAAWVLTFLSVVISYETVPDPGPTELMHADSAIKRSLLP